MSISILNKIFFKIIFVLSFLVSSSVFAQDGHFRIINFDNSKGLTSNLIKNITQDNYGYIWVVTDGGLLKYDGNKFLTHNNNLPTIFLKDIKKIRNGSLLVASDLSISQVYQNKDTVDIRELIPGKTFYTDSTLYYPKTIFEDNTNRLWISDFRSISNIKGRKLVKYDFDEKYWSDDYTVSYKIAQNSKGDILATSWQGYLFHFNSQAQSFRPLELEFKEKIMFENLVCINDWFYLATSEGVFRFKFSDGSISDLQKIIDVKAATSVAYWNGDQIVIATKNKGVFLYKLSTKELTEINGLRGIIVKNLFVDSSFGIWVAADQGLFLLKENLFNTVSYKSANTSDEVFYIRKIEVDANDKVYFNALFSLYELSKNEDTESMLMINQQYQVFDFAVSKNKYFISTRQGDLICFNHNYEIIHKMKFKNDRPNQLFIDSKNNLWLYLENLKKVVSINDNYEITEYKIPKHSNSYVELIKEINGEIYISGLGDEILMSKLNRETSSFVSLIKETPNKIQANVFDFTKLGDTFYLATNSGLLKLIDGVIHNVSIPNSQNQLVVKAVEIDNQNRIWCGTDFGLILIDKNQFIFFDQKDGLPNSTISMQGIKASKDKIWIGTPSGIAYFKINKVLHKLKPPKITDISFKKGDIVYNHYQDKIYSGANLTVEYSTLNYPTGRTFYYTRVIGIDTAWTAQRLNFRLQIQNLSAGEYNLQIKAENPGTYESDISEFAFEVFNPWYLSSTIFPLYVILLLIVFTLTALKYNQIKLKNVLAREKLLNEKVEQRTLDLNREKEKTEFLLFESEKSKAQLQAANELKSQLLSIAAHDLKNPLQVILGYEFYKEDMTLNEEEEEMLTSIFNAAKKMIGMISETLESAATDAAQLQLTLIDINLEELFSQIVKDQKILASRKNQKIISKFDNNINNVKVDKFWFREACDNLISNSIKYSPKGSEIFIGIRNGGDSIKISIQDQGPGFSKSDKDKLFTKFQRLSAKPTAGESSTGLGLFIVKQILDKHNFNISLESEQNEGSTFIIEIPI